jgi:hypothetical protein
MHGICHFWVILQHIHGVGCRYGCQEGRGDPASDDQSAHRHFDTPNIDAAPLKIPQIHPLVALFGSTGLRRAMKSGGDTFDNFFFGGGGKDCVCFFQHIHLCILYVIYT